MSEETDIQRLIEAISSGVKRAEVDGQVVENYSVDDLLKALRALKAQEATGKNGFGLRFAKLEHSASC